MNDLKTNKIYLIAEKELYENLCKKTFIGIMLFLILYAGYLNFLSMEIFTGLSAETELSPQLIMSADPNQGILAPLFSNLFIVILLIFPVIISTSISAEKNNNTFSMLKLIFNDTTIIIGKFIAYFILALSLFLITFLLLIPYILHNGFIDRYYILNVFFGFIIITSVWILLSLLISAITPLSLSFYTIMLFNISILLISFISDIVNFKPLKLLNNILPYSFYDYILKGIFDLKLYTAYSITGVFLFLMLKSVLSKKKYIVLYTILYILSIFIINLIDIKKDVTFNKINSLSSNAINVLNKIKDKDVKVILYIKEDGPKWQTAVDLINTFRLNFKNIKFIFLEPDENIEYGLIKFKYKNRTAKTLSVDEDIFVKNIFFVATGKKLSMEFKKKQIGKPFKFTYNGKILYLLWTFFIVLSILYGRKLIIKGGIKL